MNVKTKVIRILMFGFDKVDFELKDNSHKIDGIIFDIKAYSESLEFENYDGMIIPSGIFESNMTNFQKIRYDADRIVEFERVIRNMIMKGSWVVFLMTKIVKSFEYNYQTHDLSKTDLAKKLLLTFFPASVSKLPNAYLNSKRDEFRDYTKSFGVGVTEINSSSSSIEYTTLISADSVVFGIETVNKRMFFLPFHTTKKSFEELVKIGELTSRAVSRYRKNTDTELPEWIKKYMFNEETILIDKRSQLENEVDYLNSKIKDFEKHKNLLHFTGDQLSNEVAANLRDFWGLTINDTDLRLDDMSILDESNNVLCSVEVKGVEGDVKRKYLSQLNSNRDMKDYPSETTGLLIINDAISASNMVEKKTKIISQDVLDYSIREKIFILKTIDLLQMMNDCFSKPHEERAIYFLNILNGNGGWITFENNLLVIKVKSHSG